MSRSKSAGTAGHLGVASFRCMGDFRVHGSHHNRPGGLRGTLVGSGVAIGLYCGRNIGAPPEEYPNQRSRAIEGVKQLYGDFIKTFDGTDCLALCRCDFSNPQDVARYVENRAWKETCDLFLNFAITKCLQMSRDGVI